MRYALALLFLVLLAGEAAAQFQGTVVQTCGTLPQAYSPGSTRLPAIDVNGNLCSSGAFPPAGQLPGTATNDNAAAGNVGEYIESQIPVNTAQALSTGVVLNITSIVLTPGDWEVGGSALFIGTGTTTVTALTGGLSDVSATLQTAPTSRVSQPVYASGTIFTAGLNTFLNIGPTRWSVNTNTTIYLIAKAVFAASTCSTNGGHLWARRMR